MKDKLFCNNCKGLRNQTEVHKVEERGGDEEGDFQWYKSYSIIKCAGCDSISFHQVYGDTEMFEQTGPYGEHDYYYDESVYPPYLKRGEAIQQLFYLPEKIRTIYTETIASFKSNSSILTAGGLRAIIEAICNNLKITGNNLAERIDGLSKNGHLTLAESKRLHSIRFLGNDALHEIEKPKDEHLYLLLEIVNHLLSNLFVNDKKMKGKVETMIDTYDDFIRLIQNRIDNDMVGKKMTLSNILDKSKRLLTKKNLTEFENSFIKDINSKKITFVKVEKKKPDNIYEIVERPMLFQFGIK
ncbi:DUF4145 domain-containing protein [Tenacibaculum finnmarkense]|uniref:DUF4145 domain-containing protein n=1 Tax=Tenacibaculum finnmarkense TaxID=2781243 RepID=UPI001E34C73C|nr:DUF4145 domain-containing protein [Tenacibaculum finnmarkense]MCD8413642.1 DUF4145 domain-containing protein [Tenacibaculum finnmarkense genomovar ulcerans]